MVTDSIAETAVQDMQLLETRIRKRSLKRSRPDPGVALNDESSNESMEVKSTTMVDSWTYLKEILIAERTRHKKEQKKLLGIPKERLLPVTLQE